MSSHVFELRVNLAPYQSKPQYAIVRAYEAGMAGRYHTRLDLELRFAGVTLWERGSAYIGVPGNQCIDSGSAKESALSLFAMEPGDTDADFFADYTPEQLDFCATYSDQLTMLAFDRYGEP